MASTRLSERTVFAAQQVRRVPHVFAIVLMALALIAGSRPRVVGDGGEYVATAFNLVDGRGVAMTAAEIAALHERVAPIDPVLADWDIGRSTFANRSGLREFGHFWFYPALAAPFLAASLLAGLSPLAGFTAVNVALYAGAWALLARRAPWQVQVILLVGPIVWWLDKAHTEVLTITALSVAAAFLHTHPWWSAVAAGAASVQNPPLSVLAFGAAAITFARGPSVWRKRSVWMAVGAGLALAVLHPAYYLARFGTVSPLVQVSYRRLPAIAELGLVIWDPTLGLIASWPCLALIVVAALVTIGWHRTRAVSMEAVVIGVTLAAALVAFAQTPNPAHGGTPGMSRYALWLAPLLLPLLMAADDVGGRLWRITLTTSAVASTGISLIAFHPARPELSHRPTWVASWLWTHHPAWSNPPARVFVDSLDQHGGLTLPVTTPDCRKALLTGRGEQGGMWPVPCLPMPVPPHCREPGAICYANARAAGYTFEPVHSAAGRKFIYARERAWPSDAEAGVAEALASAGWWSAQHIPRSSVTSILRAADGVRAGPLFQGPDGAILLLRDSSPGAKVHLRPAGPVRGVFVSGTTGATLNTVEYPVMADDGWRVEVPPGHELLVLALVIGR